MLDTISDNKKIVIEWGFFALVEFLKKYDQKGLDVNHMV